MTDIAKIDSVNVRFDRAAEAHIQDRNMVEFQIEERWMLSAMPECRRRLMQLVVVDALII